MVFAGAVLDFVAAVVFVAVVIVVVVDVVAVVVVVLVIHLPSLLWLWMLWPSFNRFAHSAGPDLKGSGVDGLLGFSVDFRCEGTRC